MKDEKHKKVKWNTPKLLKLDFQETLGGLSLGTTEDTTYKTS